MMNNKSKMNKFVTGAATAAMVATAVVPVASAAGFNDLDKVGPSVKVEIDKAVELGFFKEATKFNPGVKITRGQAALTLARYIAGDSTVKSYVETNNLESTVTAFNDVPATYKNGADFQQELYYASLVVRNADAFTQSNLNPTGNVTRSQMAKIITQTFELEKVEGYVSNLTDIGQLDAGTKGFIETIASHGITNVTAFNPAGPVTRSQMASFLVRSYDAVHVEADLEITSVKGLEDLSITAGEELALPDMVEVVYSDDSTAHVGVEWNTAGIDFEVAGTYELTGTIANTTLKATVKVKVEALVPAVTSVKAINATQVEVKFNKAVDKSTLFEANGDFKVANLTFTPLESQGATVSTTKATLSEDGKTLVVTANKVLEKRYDVVIDNVKSKDGKDLIKYEEMITIAADKTAPTILGTEKLTATTVKVKFSEPMKKFTGVTFKYADGSAISAPGVSGTISAGAEEAVFTMGTGVDAGKEIIATFIGAQDQVGNLLTPNPATVTFQKGNKDGVAPTVGVITQTGATTFSIKFSEELQVAPTVTYDTDATTVVKDATDATVYNVTVAPGTVLEGAKTIVVSAFTDLSGEAGTTTSKVVSFVKDADAPKVTSSAVVKDETDAFEYLELTFDKDVVLTNSSLVAAATTNGSYVKDFVTTQIANTELVNGPITYKESTNKKVVRVKLDTLLGAKDIKDATYTLNLALTAVNSSAAVAITNAEVTFTRGEDGVAPNSTVLGVPTVTADAADNNKVNVSFPAAVDGASAINVANYQIDGVVVESVTLKSLSGGAQVAVLNLKADSSTFTGVRNINISGVKALGSSKTMAPFFTNKVILKENVAPTVTSAKLTDTDKVTITFSEAVTTTAVATDFDLLIGGTVANTVTAEAVTGNEVVFTLTTPVTTENITSGLALKAKSTLSIKDGAGNNLSVPANIVITQ